MNSIARPKRKAVPVNLGIVPALPKPVAPARSSRLPVKSAPTAQPLQAPETSPARCGTRNAEKHVVSYNVSAMSKRSVSPE